MEFLEEFRFNNPTNNLMTGVVGIGKQRKKSSVIPTGHVGLRDIAKTEIWPFLYWSFLRLIKLIFMKSSKIVISFTLRLKILVIRKTPAYPTKRINKKRISAKEAEVVFKIKVISVITSWDNCCLGWTGLASFLRTPVDIISEAELPEAQEHQASSEPKPSISANQNGTSELC